MENTKSESGKKITKTARVSLRLHEALDTKVNKLSKAYRKNKTKMIEELIERAIKGYEG